MRKITTLFLSAVLLCMAACGNKQETDTAEWVYVPEYLDLENGDSINWNDALLVGDDLYYVSYDWAMESETYSMALNRYSVTEGTAEEMSLSLPEEASMYCWTIGNDGSLYAVLAIWRWNEATGMSNNTYMLAKYDRQGKELFVNDFTNLLDGEDYLNGISADGEGRIYVSGQSAIWLFDANSQPAGNINLNFGMGGWIDSICRGADGRIYAALSGNNGTALWTVDFEKKSLGDSYSDFPSAEAICQNAEGNFLLHDRTSVYVYDVKSQKKEKLFDWLDCDINGNYVSGFGILSDGRIVAAFENWQSNDRGMVALSRVKAGEVIQKQQRIVLGMLYQDSSIEAAIVNFNKSNDTYHVTVRHYIDYDSWSDTSVSDALARMNSDITSGNCPDILCLEGVNVQQLAAKGVFEDLNPYLDQSSMDRCDMLDNVLDAYTYDGRLICILDRFSVETVVGSKAQVGEEMGWTLDEMIAFADSHPDAELFDRMPKEDIFDFCLTYNIDTFVDWKTGNCHFDSEEFKSLLEFVGRFPSYEEMTYEEGRLSMPERIQIGEVLLTEAWFHELDMMQLYLEMFGVDVTCIGYPNTGGSGAFLSPYGAYAIMASSKVKEGAWAFLESYLTRESDFRSRGFPNSKSRLESMADEAVNVVYILDENGEPMLDAHGNPMAEGVGSKGWGWDDWEYYFRIPTQEEVDMVLQLINAASLPSESSEQIMDIINEEAAAFFKGQKSVDDVAEIIQRRVSIYVSENY